MENEQSLIEFLLSGGSIEEFNAQGDEMRVEEGRSKYTPDGYVAPPPEVQGLCHGCGRGIPVGYLARVSKWKSVNMGTTSHPVPVNKPEVLWCQGCKS